MKLKNKQINEPNELNLSHNNELNEIQTTFITNSNTTNEMIEGSNCKLIEESDSDSDLLKSSEGLIRIYKAYKDENKIGKINVLYLKGNEPIITIGPDCM